jgi:outer membrane protein
MKLTVITTLLTISLVTAAFSAEEAPPAVAQPKADVTATTPSAPSPAPTPSVAVPTPPAPTPPPAADSPAKGPSLMAGPLLAPPAAASAPIKLGYVDFQKIAQESKVALKAKNSITASGEKLKKQLTAKGKKLEALKKTLESQAKQMNQLEQEAKGKEFQAKVKEYQEALQSAEKEMAKQEESVTRKLIEQVSQVVKAYGEQNRYTLILSTKDLLYFDGNHPLDDVTAEVIKILDK